MNKREFLKLAGAASVMTVVATGLRADPKKVTEEEWHLDPEDKHTPVVSFVRTGDLVEIKMDVTLHPQTAEHFIDEVRVHDEKRAVLFSSVILPVTGVSYVVCKLKAAEGTKLTAVSHCNKHGVYRADFTV